MHKFERLHPLADLNSLPEHKILSIKSFLQFYQAVKHCLDFSFVFSAPLPAWRNLFSASGIFCYERYQPGWWNVHNHIHWCFIPIFSCVQVNLDLLHRIGALRNEDVIEINVFIGTFHLFPETYAFLSEVEVGINTVVRLVLYPGCFICGFLFSLWCALAEAVWVHGTCFPCYWFQ